MLARNDGPLVKSQLCDLHRQSAAVEEEARPSVLQVLKGSRNPTTAVYGLLPEVTRRSVKNVPLAFLQGAAGRHRELRCDLLFVVICSFDMSSHIEQATNDDGMPVQGFLLADYYSGKLYSAQKPTIL